MTTAIKYEVPTASAMFPGSSTDNAIARFNGTTGILQNSAAILYDTGNIKCAGIGLGTAGEPGQKLHMVDGNFLFDGTDEIAILFKRATTVGTQVNPIFAVGRIADDGTGMPALRTLYNDDVIGETLLFQLSSNGNPDYTGNKIRLRTTYTPASAAAAGSAGEIAWDASYIYIATASNTWKRAAISTW